MAGFVDLVIRVVGKADVGKAFDKVTDEVEDIGKAAKNATAPAGRLAGKLNNLGESGGNAEQGLRGVADISEFAGSQLGLPLGPLQANAAALANLGGGIEGLLKGFPALVGQIGTMIPLLGAKAAAWWAVAAATIAANAPLIIIIAAIALLAVGIILLVKHWDTITEKVPLLGAAFDAVKAVIEKVASWFTGGLVDALMHPQRALEDVLGFARDHWPEIATLISGPFFPIVALATDAFGVRSGLLGSFHFVLGFARDHWPEIATLISGPFFPLVLLATDAFGVRSALLGSFDDVLGFGRDHWPEIATLISGPFAPLIILATDAFGVRSALMDGLGGLVSWVGDKLGEIGGFFVNLIDGPIQWTIDRVWQLINAIRSIPSPTDFLPNIPGMPGGGFDITPGFDPPGPLAAGGPARAGRTYWVGERGPELFRPGVSGTVIPNHELAGAGGITLNTGPVTVNNYGAQQDAEGALKTLAFETNRQIRQRGGFVMA